MQTALAFNARALTPSRTGARRAVQCPARFSLRGVSVRASQIEAARPQTLVKASSPEPMPEQQREEGPLEGALPALNRWWDELTWREKIYSLVAVIAMTYLLPEAFIFFIMSIERLFVGSFLALEDVIVQVLFKTTALGLTAGVGMLIFAGIFLFGEPKEKERK